MKLKLLSALIAACFVQVSQAQYIWSKNTSAIKEVNDSATLTQMRVQETWARGITGKGAVIGILDNGFDLTHPDLKNAIISSRNFTLNTPVTWGRHGTAMAALAVAPVNGSGIVGVAPDARLVLGQVGNGGSDPSINEAALLNGLTWMSQQNVDVVSLSLGFRYSLAWNNSLKRATTSGVYIPGTGFTNNFNRPSAEINYYRQVTDTNKVIVVASGNQGLAYSQFPAMYATRTNSSGQLELGGRMLVVGAVDKYNRIASYSNRAGHICQTFQGTQCQDRYLTRDFFVVAPGSSITVPLPTQLRVSFTTEKIDGTSPATAYVAGGIALMRQAWPYLKSEQLVARVLSTTTDLGVPGTDDIYGRGLVNFDAATRPQGQLYIASSNQSLTSNGSTTLTPNPTVVPPRTAVAWSSANMYSALTKNLGTSSILSASQAIDELGRNYTVDLTRAINQQRLMAYSADSPYLAIQGFQQALVPMTDNMVLKVMNSVTGSAGELQIIENNTRYQLQVGSMREQGFLGNYGQGAMGLGSSSTSWAMIGIDQQIGNDYSIIAQYARGITSVNNDPFSMIQVGTLVTQSWSFGLAKNNIISYNDRAVVTLGTPVNIRSGKAKITGVVGYDYNEDQEGNIIANPITASENINLRSPSQEFNLNINYRHNLDKNSFVSYTAQQRFNLSLGSSNFFGMNFTWIQ